MALVRSVGFNLFVRFEVEKSPSTFFLEGQIHDAFNKPLSVVPRGRRFTTAAVCLGSRAGTPENRLAQHCLDDVCCTYYLLLGGAKRPAFQLCKTKDDISVAVQRVLTPLYVKTSV